MAYTISGVPVEWSGDFLSSLLTDALGVAPTKVAQLTRATPDFCVVVGAWVVVFPPNSSQVPRRLRLVEASSLRPMAGRGEVDVWGMPLEAVAANDDRVAAFQASCPPVPSLGEVPPDVGTLAWDAAAQRAWGAPAAPPPAPAQPAEQPVSPPSVPSGGQPVDPDMFPTPAEAATGTQRQPRPARSGRAKAGVAKRRRQAPPPAPQQALLVQLAASDAVSAAAGISDAAALPPMDGLELAGPPSAPPSVAHPAEPPVLTLVADMALALSVQSGPPSPGAASSAVGPARLHEPPPAGRELLPGEPSPECDDLMTDSSGYQQVRPLAAAPLVPAAPPHTRVSAFDRLGAVNTH